MNAIFREFLDCSQRLSKDESQSAVQEAVRSAKLAWEQLFTDAKVDRRILASEYDRYPLALERMMYAAKRMPGLLLWLQWYHTLYTVLRVRGIEETNSVLEEGEEAIESGRPIADVIRDVFRDPNDVASPIVVNSVSRI